MENPIQEQVEDKDMVQVMEDTRLKCLNMIEQAVSAMSVVGSDTRIVLPDALKYPREFPLAVVAIAMRTPSKWFWQRRKPSEPVFYFRNDYAYTKNNEYAKSATASFTERALLRSLDKHGWWGNFLRANENFLRDLKLAIEEGKKNSYPNSPVKDLDWLEWNA